MNQKHCHQDCVKRGNYSRSLELERERVEPSIAAVCEVDDAGLKNKAMKGKGGLQQRKMICDYRFRWDRMAIRIQSQNRLRWPLERRGSHQGTTR